MLKEGNNPFREHCRRLGLQGAGDLIGFLDIQGSGIRYEFTVPLFGFTDFFLTNSAGRSVGFVDYVTGMLPSHLALKLCFLLCFVNS